MTRVPQIIKPVGAGTHLYMLQYYAAVGYLRTQRFDALCMPSYGDTLGLN